MSKRSTQKAARQAEKKLKKASGSVQSTLADNFENAKEWAAPKVENALNWAGETFQDGVEKATPLVQRGVDKVSGLLRPLGPRLSKTTHQLPPNSWLRLPRKPRTPYPTTMFRHRCRTCWKPSPAIRRPRRN